MYQMRFGSSSQEGILFRGHNYAMPSPIEKCSDIPHAYYLRSQVCPLTKFCALAAMRAVAPITVATCH